MKISCPWRGCFRARSQRATEGEALLLTVGSHSEQEQEGVSLSGGALLCVDRPWWGTTWLGRYVLLSGHDLFPERIAANPLPYCFDGGFSSHTFNVSWPSPLNTTEFLIKFNCPIDEISRNFQWFQEFENLRIWFSAFVKGNHSHMVFLETSLNVNSARDVSKLPWHKYLKGQ